MLAAYSDGILIKVGLVHEFVKIACDISDNKLKVFNKMFKLVLKMGKVLINYWALVLEQEQSIEICTDIF